MYNVDIIYLQLISIIIILPCKLEHTNTRTNGRIENIVLQPTLLDFYLYI